MPRPFAIFRCHYLLLLAACFLHGCVTMTDPKTLQVPEQISCTYLEQPVSYTLEFGPFGVRWTTRLEKGPYWSERVDSNGTYYRAPPGGILILDKDGLPYLGQATRDGGIYLPDDPTKPPTVYTYFSTAEAPTAPELLSADCTSVGLFKDPHSEKVGLSTFALAGAVGGAAGGLAGRSLANSSAMSYGQAAGVGAAGGLIGGVIVAALINADVGKMVPLRFVPDTPAANSIRAAAAKNTPMLAVQPVPAAAVAAPLEPTAGTSDNSP